MSLIFDKSKRLESATKYFHYSFIALLAVNSFGFGMSRGNPQYYEAIVLISFLFQLLFAFFAFRLSKALGKPWWISVLLAILCAAGRLLSLIGFTVLFFMNRKVTKREGEA